MESNESKKLSFKTETIASLSNVEQNEGIIGGGETCTICGTFSVLFWTLCGEAGTCYTCTCGGPGGGDTLDERDDIDTVASCFDCGPSCQCISENGMGPCVSN